MAGLLAVLTWATAHHARNFLSSEALWTDTVAKNPDLVRTMIKIQRQASEYMMANMPAVVDATVTKLGANKAAVEQALGTKNVEYVWKLDPTVLGQAKTYAQHMLDLKQIRALPNFDTFLNPKFSNEVANS